MSLQVKLIQIHAGSNGIILGGPHLLSYTISLSSQEITLQFDRPIEPSSINIPGITIQGARSVIDANLYYRLSSTSMSSVDNSTVRIQISDLDFDALQLRTDVATTRSNTFLSMEPNTVTDRSNLHIMAQRISSADALQPTDFIRDSTPPEIESFSLNLDTNSMAVTFSEPVLVSSFNPQNLVLRSQLDPASGESYTLTGGTVRSTASAASHVINFTLTDGDVTFLETNALIATGLTNVFLSASMPVAQDTNNNTNVALSSLSVDVFVADTSPPSVIAFDLDMDDGVLEILFNDPVNTSTFNPTSITLQSRVTRRSIEWVTLGSQSSTNSPVGYSIAISIDNADINEVKAIRSLCTQGSDCFMTIAASAVLDSRGTGTNPVTDGQALIVRRYTPDTTPPEVNSWELDMNTGRITISFSETIDITTFLPGGLVLSSSMNGVVSHRLSVLSELSPRDAASAITVQLTAGDINAIKINEMLGTNLDNSFLSIQPRSFRDMFSNHNQMVVSGANRFIPDTTSPSLLHFSFNAYAGVLSLTFSEVIDTSTFNASGLTLVNQPSQSLVQYNIRSGTTADSNGLEIRVMLSDIDQNELNAMADLATSPDNTYIITSMFTVEDMNTNPLNSISADSALRVLYYLNSPVLIFLEFPKYYYNEGQTVMLRVFLNTTAASDVTFTLTMEDGGAMGEHLYCIIEIIPTCHEYGGNVVGFLP